MFRRETGRGQSRAVAVVAAAAHETVPVVVAEDAGHGAGGAAGREVEGAVNQAGTGAGQAGVLEAATAAAVSAVLGDSQGPQLASSPPTDCPLLTGPALLPVDSAQLGHQVGPALADWSAVGPGGHTQAVLLRPLLDL